MVESEDLEERVVRLYVSGWSKSSIASVLKQDKKKISAILKRRGVENNPRVNPYIPYSRRFINGE